MNSESARDKAIAVPSNSQRFPSENSQNPPSQLVDELGPESRAKKLLRDATLILELETLGPKDVDAMRRLVTGALAQLEGRPTRAPIAWAVVVPEDGFVSWPIEGTRESAEECARIYAKNSGAPAPYAIEPLVLADERLTFVRQHGYVFLRERRDVGGPTWAHERQDDPPGSDLDGGEADGSALAPLNLIELEVVDGKIQHARRLTCVHCGCTDTAACSIQVVQLATDDRKAVELYYRENGWPIGERVPCWWISEDPAVCSNPHCAELHRASGWMSTAASYRKPGKPGAA